MTRIVPPPDWVQRVGESDYGWQVRLGQLCEGNEDGTNRDVPPWDNDPRTDDEIKQEVYDRLSDPDYDDDHPYDWEE